MCKRFGWKMKLSWVGFNFWHVFVGRVLYFFSEHFFTIWMGNNNKMTKNNVRMVWVPTQVIVCWFVTLTCFRSKWLKLLTVIFISLIDGKQQQNDRKLCAKDLGKKCSYLGLVSIFGTFSCLGSCTFVLSIFLTMLIGNNNKMIENDMSIVSVKKQVIMCWFLTHLDGNQQQNDQKLCAKDLGEECSYHRLVSIFSRFSCLGSCTFVLSIF